MEEKKTEFSEQKKEEQFLTLHFFHGEQTKSFILKKQHTLVICLAAAIVVVSSVFSMGSYFSAKNDLKVSAQQLKEVTKTKKQLEEKANRLETENAEYHENITDLQNKAAEIENKMIELEKVKESLSDKLHELSQNGNSAATVCSTMAASIQNTPADAPAFTSIVHTSYSRLTSLSSELDKLNQQMDLEGISFVDVADDVTETLSAIASSPSGFPCYGRVSSEFNPLGDSSISDGRVHKGIDIATSRNNSVQATADGTVVDATFHPGYGYYVKIDHGGGFKTLYAHNSSLNCSVGDTVKKGDTIAFAGSTGNSTGVHVHYEVILNGIHQNPRDYT